MLVSKKFCKQGHLGFHFVSPRDLQVFYPRNFKLLLLLLLLRFRSKDRSSWKSHSVCSKSSCIEGYSTPLDRLDLCICVGIPVLALFRTSGCSSPTSGLHLQPKPNLEPWHRAASHASKTSSFASFPSFAGSFVSFVSFASFVRSQRKFSKFSQRTFTSWDIRWTSWTAWIGL